MGPPSSTTNNSSSLGTQGEGEVGFAKRRGSGRLGGMEARRVLGVMMRVIRWDLGLTIVVLGGSLLI